MSPPELPAFWAVIPAAGVGARMRADRPKQYLELAGRTILEHSLACFLDHPNLKRVVVGLSVDDPYWPELDCASDSRIERVDGGKERADTVLKALLRLDELGARPNDWVLVHDAARCLITPQQIRTLIDACVDDAVGGLLAHKLPDTLKTAVTGPTGVRVAATVDRSDKWLAQTPQMFRIGPLLDAISRAGAAVTDEASAMEAMGLRPKLVPGGAQNFKVTYPDDFALAAAVLSQRGRATTAERFQGRRNPPSASGNPFF